MKPNEVKRISENSENNKQNKTTRVRFQNGARDWLKLLHCLAVWRRALM